MYLLSCYEEGPDEFMYRDVAQDVTWIHLFDPEILNLKSKACSGSTLAHLPPSPPSPPPPQEI